jgi:hypothetical protein
MGSSDASFDITKELTIGGWVYFSPGSSGIDMGIISKWDTSLGNSRAYLLNKDANNKFKFSICSDGTAGRVISVDDNSVNFAEETWFFVVGRYTPSKEIALFVNGSWYRNTTAIHAALFDTPENLEIGRYSRANYLNGRASHAFICAYSVPDRFIEAMYAHARALFKSKTLGVLAP